MPYYIVYQLLPNHRIKQLEQVKAITNESARRKAILGTTIPYDQVRAFCQRQSRRIV